MFIITICTHSCLLSFSFGRGEGGKSKRDHFYTTPSSYKFRSSASMSSYHIIIVLEASKFQQCKKNPDRRMLEITNPTIVFLTFLTSSSYKFRSSASMSSYHIINVLEASKFQQCKKNPDRRMLEITNPTIVFLTFLTSHCSKIKDFIRACDMNQETSIIQYTSMKM